MLHSVSLYEIAPRTGTIRRQVARFIPGRSVLSSLFEMVLSFRTKLKFIEEGIAYDELSEEDKAVIDGS